MDRLCVVEFSGSGKSAWLWCVEQELGRVMLDSRLVSMQECGRMMSVVGNSTFPEEIICVAVRKAHMSHS